MFLMGDIIEAELEREKKAAKKYERNNGGNKRNPSPAFPFVFNQSSHLEQNAGTMYNITLTDEQFERLLDTIKSLYR